MAFDKFTDKARHVLVLAREEAAVLKRPHVGTEHLLLGIVREGEGGAIDAMAKLGVEIDAVRSALNDLVDQPTPVAAGMPFFGGEPHGEKSMLEQFGTDLNR